MLTAIETTGTINANHQIELDEKQSESMACAKIFIS